MSGKILQTSCTFGFLIALLLSHSPAVAQPLPSLQIGDTTVYPTDECTDQNAYLVYHEAVADVTNAMDDGSIRDSRLLDYLIDHESELTRDIDALAELLTPVDRVLEPELQDLEEPQLSMESPRGGQRAEAFARSENLAMASDGNGSVCGGRTSLRNIFGWEVGSAQSCIVWGTRGCCSVITGKTFVGSIPLGNCKVKQIGRKHKQDCSPATERCPDPEQECGFYQWECWQGPSICRLNSLHGPVEKLCAPCPG